MPSATVPFPTIRRERTLAAPPHAVYRAWLDPQLVRRWLAPGGPAPVRAEIDERVGGRYRVHQPRPDVPVDGFEAELLELVPDERIVLRWGFTGSGREEGPHFDSLLTVTLHPAPGGGTRLVLLHEHLGALAEALPEAAAQAAGGWDALLDGLTAAVAA
ncbi:SRPBCC domain-containing protein [Kitasatospora sp. NPDC048365]|uniref:SRPBCC family protein n=1 Tax=Kitasatospora sp. NPDC048365 TaxID=3364050 RepID=UPI003722A8B2